MVAKGTRLDHYHHLIGGCIVSRLFEIIGVLVFIAGLFQLT